MSATRTGGGDVFAGEFEADVAAQLHYAFDDLRLAALEFGRRQRRGGVPLYLAAEWLQLAAALTAERTLWASFVGVVDWPAHPEALGPVLAAACAWADAAGEEAPAGLYRAALAFCLEVGHG